MIGTQFLHYLVEAHLGTGGMGEVYRARDTRLGRCVAIKVLPELVAMDPERVARFEREARLLASLNHPNIAALHGFEPSAARPFLVMELVEGDTLAQRIARGPIPVDEALTYAHQIAEALEAAHERGIVHRDLKPANVKVTPDGKVKVLDFGLAKALGPPEGGHYVRDGRYAQDGRSVRLQPDLTNSPTLSLMATQMGVVLGTAAYMAPEQAKGAATDQRSDIFSFGCVLYEMLTGRQSFQGDTVAEIMAAVLKTEADLTLLPSHLSPKLVDLIGRCLAKDPKRRWHAVADVRMEIEAIQADPRGLTLRAEPTEARRPLWRRAVPIAATAVVTAAIVAAAASSLRPEPPASPVTRFTIPIPEGQELTRLGRHNIALSPDGQSLVYVANTQLYLRRMGDLEARPIPGTNQDVNTPFFSPDGQWVAFYSVPDGELKKIPVEGGTAVVIAPLLNPFGAEWLPGDQILVGQGGGGIVRVSANGGASETIVKVGADELAYGPQLLPDGEHLIFTLAKGREESRWDEAYIVIESLRSSERAVLISGGSDARYVPTGHIVYATGSNVMAVPFDESSRHLAGSAVALLADVSRSPPANTAATFMAFSPNGSMAYLAGALDATRRLALVDWKGVADTLPLPSALYADPRLSPDGQQLAVTVNATEGLDLWLHDLAGKQAPRRLTFGGRSHSPAWMADGQRLVFVSADGTAEAIFWQAADGSGSAERLTDPGIVQPIGPRPSRDGRRLVYQDRRGGIWLLPLDGERKPQLLVDGQGEPTEASLSPDGRWLLYRAMESRLPAIFVQPVPLNGAKYQVSTTPAHDPIWSSDGRQISYLEDLPNGNHRLTAVEVDTKAGFKYSAPTGLFDNALDPAGTWAYDATPDSRRFLVMRREERTVSQPEITVTLNWFDELRRRVPR
jgi:serine/threonine-protein kinase